MAVFRGHSDCKSSSKYILFNIELILLKLLVPYALLYSLSECGEICVLSSEGLMGVGLEGARGNVGFLI